MTGSFIGRQSGVREGGREGRGLAIMVRGGPSRNEEGRERRAMFSRGRGGGGVRERGRTIWLNASGRTRGLVVL